MRYETGHAEIERYAATVQIKVSFYLNKTK